MATTASTLLTAPIRAPFPTKINTKIFLNSIKMSPSPSSSSSMMMMMMMSSLNTKTTTTTSSNRIIAASTSQSTSLGFGEENNSRSQQQLAVLLEVEGVLMDVYRLVNRESFNLAFRKLGLDCANWTEPIYWDLMRKAGGDEKIMLVLFFNRIGWPTSLPTSEKETFMKSVLLEKRRAFDEYVMTKDIPLRPGVEDFIDDALNEGLPVIALTAYSKHGDKVARSIVEKLGHERISRIKIIGQEEVEGSFYGQLVLGRGVQSGLDEQLAKEVRKAASAEKQRITEEVAAVLNVSIAIDTTSTESFEKIVATLRAGVEYAGVLVQNCVLIAGSRPGVLGAECLGLPCVFLRSSLTSRAECRSAKAILDDFGEPDLTVSKLRRWWP